MRDTTDVWKTIATGLAGIYRVMSSQGITLGDYRPK